MIKNPFIVVLIAATLALVAVAIGIFGGASRAEAAPQFIIQPTILPQVNEADELGTSTRQWLRTFTEALCLDGDCRATWPASGSSGIATQTPWTIPNLVYVVGNGTVSSVATTTLTGNSQIALSQPIVVVGPSASVLSIVADSIGDTQLAFDTGQTLTTAASPTFAGLTVGTINGLIKGTTGVLSAASAGTDYVAPATTLTVAGTTNQITSSAGAQDLSTNRTWTLSLPSHVIFPRSFQVTSATTTNATTTGSQYITPLATAAGAFLAIDPDGKVIATTSPSGGGITAIGPAGQTSDGPTVTFATSASATNGITSVLTIVGSGDTLTFTPSQSGTLTVAGGGTGATTFTDNRLLTGNGTSALVDEANLTFDGSLLSVTGRGSITGTTTIGYGTNEVTVNGTVYPWKVGISEDDVNQHAGILIERNATTCPLGCGIVSARSRGDRNTKTVVQDGDEIGNYWFTAYDGTDYGIGARLQVEVDGTPGANDTPARFAFYTTPDGSSSPTERLTIRSTGLVGIGTTTPRAARLSVASSTGPQLSLSDASATQNPWNYRSINGNLFLATSSPTTFATSSVSAFSIDTSGYLTNPVLGTAAGTFVAADPTGKLIATSTPSSSYTASSSIQKFTASTTPTTTWTKPAGLAYVVVKVVGPGGGGGGVNAASSENDGGGGGGGGGYCEETIPAAALGATETVTVGGGGAGGVETTGSPGQASSSFGSHCTAGPGSAGTGGTGNGNVASGGAGGTASGGDLNSTGGGGTAGFGGSSILDTSSGLSGAGGSSVLGGGGNGFGGGTSAQTGTAGGSYGGGGGGAWGVGGADRNGGAGAAGAVFVYEYF